MWISGKSNGEVVPIDYDRQVNGNGHAGYRASLPDLKFSACERINTLPQVNTNAASAMLISNVKTLSVIK